MSLERRRRLYSAGVCSDMLYERQTRAVKDVVIKLERNDARMGRWMFSATQDHRVSAVEFRNRSCERVQVRFNFSNMICEFS